MHILEPKQFVPVIFLADSPTFDLQPPDNPNSYAIFPTDDELSDDLLDCKTGDLFHYGKIEYNNRSKIVTFDPIRDTFQQNSRDIQFPLGYQLVQQKDNLPHSN